MDGAGSLTWDEHQRFEADHWSDCANTFDEENKQVLYAARMGLQMIRGPHGEWPCYDMAGRTVLDIGGGPVSILLKCLGLGCPSFVLDPCPFPDWVAARYQAHGIWLERMAAEHAFIAPRFDEVWVYNVLQHVHDPERVAALAVNAGRIVRVFDWLDTPYHPGHPNTLTVEDMRRWFDGLGTIEVLEGQNGCEGRAWYGVFSH